MVKPRRYTVASRTLIVEDAYRVLAPTTLKFVLNHPRLRAMRSDAEKQSIAVTKQSVRSGRTSLGSFTGFGGQFGHIGAMLGGILGGTLGGIFADWVGLLQIVKF